jgi:hypothetical protein
MHLSRTVTAPVQRQVVRYIFRPLLLRASTSCRLV